MWCPSVPCPNVGFPKCTMPKCGAPKRTMPKCGVPKLTMPKCGVHTCGVAKCTMHKCGCPNDPCRRHRLEFYNIERRDIYIISFLFHKTFIILYYSFNYLLFWLSLLAYVYQLYLYFYFHFIIFINFCIIKAPVKLPQNKKNY